MSSDLRISPRGNPYDEDGLFDNGLGEGLLALTQEKFGEDFPGKQFFCKVFTDRLREMSSLGDLSEAELREHFREDRPSETACGFQVLSAPPFVGAEYFNGRMLLEFHKAFEDAVLRRFNGFSGSFTEFIRSLSPVWKNVGKVTFHLAENKGDQTGEHPFAFMVSFAYRVEGDRPRHLPLASALKAYAGNPEAMTAVLAPIQQAAEKSALLRQLVDSRRIFQPSAWTAGQAYAFLKDIPVFEEANIVVRIVNLWKTAPPRAQVAVTLDMVKHSPLGGGALLDFAVSMTVNGEALTQEDIDAILNSDGGLIRIKGQWIDAGPEKVAALLKQWEEAENLADEGGISLIEGLRILAGVDSPLGEKAAPLSGYCTCEASGELKKMLSGLRNPQAVAALQFPEELGKILRAYQKDGVKFLWNASELGLGTCLADDMGLGKTLQVLTLLKLWKQSGILDGLPVLLVLPATLLGNWSSESEKFTPDLKVLTLHSSGMTGEMREQYQEDPERYLGQFDLVLVSYGMVPRLPELEKMEFPAVIADEAQAIKNPASRQSRAVRKLRGRRRIALTGTPVENRLADLWSIFDFINPGLLGNLKNFLEYVKRIDGDYTSLRKLTQPFILRRLKTDRKIVPDLPDKTEMKVYCGLTKKQIVLYAQSVKEMEEALASEEDGIRRRGIVLAYLTRFKQICNHPAQFLGTGDFTLEDSSKFLRLAELVEPMVSRQEKVLVFTQYREMTEPLCNHLQDCFGRPGLVLHGGTPVKERPGLVREFQREDGPPFFVLSLKAAGVGLNLTAASHVIHFDRWWNPAVENQASDRAYRIGQKRNVLIHKFICRGTLEEKIDSLISEKQALADGVLSSGAEKLLTEMNNRELLNLVKLDINSME